MNGVSIALAGTRRTLRIVTLLNVLCINSEQAAENKMQTQGIEPLGLIVYGV
jgi:hypothetical protein